MIRPRVRVALALGLLLLGSHCSRRGDPAWSSALAEHRRAKDELFRGPDGPLDPEKRSEFRALDYFAPDPRYVVAATLARVSPPDTARFVNTRGEVERYLRLGRLRFELLGRPRELSLYAAIPALHLFLPFTDETTGRSSYGAGRYLDVLLDGDRATLDFNRAYNPWCAYSARWVCPVAPPENHLALAVLAGEKRFGHGH